MSFPIISIRNLGKQYRLGASLAHNTLRDHLVHSVRSLGKLFRGGNGEARREAETFWALQDVSFDVAPGEVIGVIGRNGAGKSTLLKILSRITDPTIGEIRVRGRLASLLEVGTGFHPELSGRENIFLNGAILGMTKVEIKKKFDEIVAFAEVDRFIDTPVKRYSSGMYVRLAFSVAAHLEPEILVVDEVLAVGDAAFQTKCLGKMEDVARNQGRTVLFVSHNMAAVQNLCGRIVYLERGRVKGIGGVEEQIHRYLADLKTGSGPEGGATALGHSLELRQLSFTPNPSVTGDATEFTLKLAAKQETRVTDLHFLVYSAYGVRVTIIDLRQPSGIPYTLKVGQTQTIRGRIPDLPLVEGDYKIGLYLKCSDYDGDFFDLAAFSVAGRVSQGGNPPYKAIYRGVVEMDYSFEVETE
ncbi:MAG: ABC transporter ATP-binding protein [Verrucomicrobiota bacterium]